jgi:ATP-dependent RNA circularization protein (DNA/RNA ligase family)
MSKKELVAVFVENASLFDKELGRLENGYNILEKKDADIWISKFPKIRIASPEEVAVVYGVK